MKEPKTFNQQIKILESRNLIINDKDQAIDFLNRVNYYRFSGYFKLFSVDDEFDGKTSFEGLMLIYNFDCQLRNLLTEALESIEVLFKTQIAYYLAINMGSFSYADSSIYSDREKYDQLMDNLRDSIERKYINEAFIKRYKNEDIPIWVIIEILSFGSISKLYSNLKENYQKGISEAYLDTNHLYLKNHMLALTAIRNNCAHGARLYGKNFISAPKISNKDKKKLKTYGINYENSAHKIFIFIYVITKYLNHSQKITFINKLDRLISLYKENISFSELGFVDNWKKIF